jgi:hypothetical protein
MKTERVLLDEREVAKMTARAVQSLRNDRHNRRGLTYVKFGRSVRYLLADIEAYIETHRISFDEEEQPREQSTNFV